MLKLEIKFCLRRHIKYDMWMAEMKGGDGIALGRGTWSCVAREAMPEIHTLPAAAAASFVCN